MINSIRTFIGAKDFDNSRAFYKEWGFEERITSNTMSYFFIDSFGFYLQDYFVQEWVQNSMVFLEVNDLEAYWLYIKAKELDKKFEGVRLIDPKSYDWGSEGFIHDPSGVLWHIGSFKK